MTYRDAYTALRSLLDDQTTRTRPADDLSVDDLVGEFARVASEARMIWTRELGPRMSWQAPFSGRPSDWELRTHCIDLDSGGRGDDQDAFSTSELALGFEDSALDMAARAYRRECRWDFSPGDGGVWLIVLRPTSWSGSEEHAEGWSASGNLVGFLILHDRDEDGEYESVAHISTAALWRRRGIATHLLEQARARFPVVAIEGPPTEPGAGLVSARAAHLGST
jgi:GNAT superfamily N-acetyltransferase